MCKTDNEKKTALEKLLGKKEKKHPILYRTQVFSNPLSISIPLVVVFLVTLA